MKNHGPWNRSTHKRRIFKYKVCNPDNRPCNITLLLWYHYVQYKFGFGMPKLSTPDHTAYQLGTNTVGYAPYAPVRYKHTTTMTKTLKTYNLIEKHPKNCTKRVKLYICSIQLSIESSFAENQDARTVEGCIWHKYCPPKNHYKLQIFLWSWWHKHLNCMQLV